MFLIDPPADCHASAVGSLMFTADGRFVVWDRVRRADAAGLVVSTDALNLGAGQQVWAEVGQVMRIAAVGPWAEDGVLVVAQTAQATACQFAGPNGVWRRALPHSATPRPGQLPYPAMHVAGGRVWRFDHDSFHAIRPDTGEVNAHPVRAENVTLVSVSPSSGWIAAAHTPNRHAEVAVWGPPLPDPILRRRTFPDFALLPGSIISALRWSADGQYLAVLIPHRLYVLDLETQEIVGPLRCPHTQLFVAPTFDPAGRRLYAGGANIDGGVYAWEVGTWQPVAAYSWPVGPVRSIAISPDGTVAAVGGQHGAVAVWDVDG